MSKKEEKCKCNHEHECECEKEEFLNDDEINEEIFNVINFYMDSSNAIRHFTIYECIFVGVVSIILTYTISRLFLLLLILIPVIIVYNQFLENHLKWKGYMLYTNYKKEE